MTFDNADAVDIYARKYTLVEGDAMVPEAYDLLTCVGRLAVGEPVPEGWRVVSGNNSSSLVVATAYRIEFNATFGEEETY